MKRIKLGEATAPLSEYVKALDNEPVIVTRNGVPVAALVAIQDADWESLSLSTNPDFIALIVRSRARQKAGEALSLEEARRRLGLTEADDEVARALHLLDNQRSDVSIPNDQPTRPKYRYVVDEQGNRVAVLLDIEEYREILEDLEDLDAIRAYDTAKSSGEEPIPLEQALAEVERDRP